MPDMYRKLKPLVCELIAVYYLDNCTGGCLHIALDDGNLEDSNIWFCQELAEKEGDLLASLIGYLLRMYTYEEREEMYNGDHWGMRK